jgi:hypothetical protein
MIGKVAIAAVLVGAAAAWPAAMNASAIYGSKTHSIISKVFETNSD